MRLESIIMEFENKPILYVQEDGSDHMIGSALSKFSSVHEKVRQPMDIYIRVNTGQIKSYFDGASIKLMMPICVFIHRP